jgi:hypothetical protein
MRRHIRNSSAIAGRRTGITSGGITMATETRPATMRFSIRLLLTFGFGLSFVTAAGGADYAIAISA